MKEFAFKINGVEYKCAVEPIEAGKTNVTVNGKVYTVETEAPAAPAPKPVAKPAPAPAPKPAAAPAAPKAEAPKPAAAPAAGVQVKSPCSSCCRCSGKKPAARFCSEGAC